MKRVGAGRTTLLNRDQCKPVDSSNRDASFLSKNLVDFGGESDMRVVLL